MVHPSIDALQIAEIASINNRIFRTLGSPRSCLSIIIVIYSRVKNSVSLTIDHVNISIDDLVSVRCQVAEQQVSFARYRPFPFWNRVRDAFLG